MKTTKVLIFEDANSNLITLFLNTTDEQIFFRINGKDRLLITLVEIQLHTEELDEALLNLITMVKVHKFDAVLALRYFSLIERYYNSVSLWSMQHSFKESLVYEELFFILKELNYDVTANKHKVIAWAIEHECYLSTMLVVKYIGYDEYDTPYGTYLIISEDEADDRIYALVEEEYDTYYCDVPDTFHGYIDKEDWISNNTYGRDEHLGDESELQSTSHYYLSYKI